MIGGSRLRRKADGRPPDVAVELGGVFAAHDTAIYVTEVRLNTPVDRDPALLHAVAGMLPPGGSEIMPDRTAIQGATA